MVIMLSMESKRSAIVQAQQFNSFAYLWKKTRWLGVPAQDCISTHLFKVVCVMSASLFGGCVAPCAALPNVCSVERTKKLKRNARLRSHRFGFISAGRISPCCRCDTAVTLGACEAWLPASGVYESSRSTTKGDNGF